MVRLSHWRTALSTFIRYLATCCHSRVILFGEVLSARGHHGGNLLFEVAVLACKRKCRDVEHLRHQTVAARKPVE